MSNRCKEFAVGGLVAFVFFWGYASQSCGMDLPEVFLISGTMNVNQTNLFYPDGNAEESEFLVAWTPSRRLFSRSTSSGGAMTETCSFVNESNQKLSFVFDSSIATNKDFRERVRTFKFVTEQPPGYQNLFEYVAPTADGTSFFLFQCDYYFGIDRSAFSSLSSSGDFPVKSDVFQGSVLFEGDKLVKFTLNQLETNRFQADRSETLVATRFPIHPKGIQSRIMEVRFDPFLPENLAHPWGGLAKTETKGVGGEKSTQQAEIKVTYSTLDEKEVNAFIDKILKSVPEGASIVSNDPIKKVVVNGEAKTAADMAAIREAQKAKFQKSNYFWPATLLVAVILGLGGWLVWRRQP